MKLLVFKVVDAAGKWIGDKIAHNWEAENRRPTCAGSRPAPTASSTCPPWAQPTWPSWATAGRCSSSTAR